MYQDLFYHKMKANSCVEKRCDAYENTKWTPSKPYILILGIKNCTTNKYYRKHETYHPNEREHKKINNIHNYSPK